MLLLDTHILLWVLDNNTKLSPNLRRIITSGDILVKVSAVSAWEIVVKKALGKLKCPNSLEEAVEASGFEWLNITVKHAMAVGDLPTFHNDPFDRLLIAQAICERLTLITTDAVIEKYPVKCLVE